MKPDAWMRAQWGAEHLIFTAVRQSEEIAWEPLYSAATIRKAMEEEPSEAMKNAIPPYLDVQSGVEIYLAMIAAKLEELK